MRQPGRTFYAGLILVATTACAATGAPLGRVAVSIAPHAYLVERIAGPRVAVTTLVAAGQSPHSFQPTPRQLSELGACRAYFTTGIAFETALLPKLRGSFRELRIVDTLAGITLRKPGAHETCTHDHDHAHDHAHDHDHSPYGAADPHVWLDPRNAARQAATITAALCELWPEQANEFRAALKRLEADLEAVHKDLSAALAPMRGREFFVFHPAFGYFADAYGLRQVAVEVDGKEPTARNIEHLIARARAAQVKIIFVQPQFPTRAAESIAREIGGVVAPMDDLAPDYLANLRDLGTKIRAALETTPTTAPAATGTGK